MTRPRCRRPRRPAVQPALGSPRVGCGCRAVFAHIVVEIHADIARLLPDDLPAEPVIVQCTRCGTYALCAEPGPDGRSGTRC